MSNLVVARYTDGRILKGASLDVSPDRPRCHLRIASGEMIQIVLAELKALFFVKSMDGNPAHVEGASIAAADPRLRGSRLIEVEFTDGERIVGLTPRYPPKGTFFFLIPVDTASNNIRILVNGDQLVGMRLVDAPPDS